MSIGQGNISFSEPPGSGGGGGGTVTGAHNGTSLNGTVVELGNLLGDATAPGKLLNDRALPLSGFSLSLLSAGLDTSFIDFDSTSLALTNMYKGTLGQEPLQLITIQGQTPGVNPYGNFFWTLDETFINTDGQRDAVWQWGYNQDGTGGRRVANEAAFWFSLESHFIPTSSAQFEHEWQSITYAGVSTRHLQLDINKTSGEADFMWTGSTWSWINDTAQGGAEFLNVVGPAGTIVLTGNAPRFTMTNTNPLGGQFSVESNPDGSLNISNQTGGADPLIRWSNPMAIDNPDSAFASLNVELINSDGIQGYAATGTISAGSGDAFPFIAQISATGAVVNLTQNLGGGDSFLIARSAVGSGNSNVQVSNGDNSKVFTLGLLQTPGNFVITNGTSVGSGTVVFQSNAAGDLSGVNGTIFQGTDAGAAPSTTTIVLPTTVYGSSAALLASPGHWAAVVIGGITYKIPLYT